MMGFLPYTKWTYPTDIRVGAGRIKELPEIVAEIGMSKPLIVTDNGLANLPMISEAKKMTGALVFSEVQGNPTDTNLDAGVAAFNAGCHDGVIAIGGGSAMDIGKLIALMAEQTIPVWDLEDIGDWWKRANINVIAPVIAIPTTAGTGSEVGRAAVLTNTTTLEKKILFHPLMLPVVVIGDPELAVGLPADLTAATGMDAFTHSFETFCTASFHPMADGIALESMRLIKTYLPIATENGSDLDARLKMFTASMMAGVAFQKGLGAVHSIAHPLGAMFGLHHGLANAILLPYVIAFNRPAIEDKLSRVAQTLKVGENYDDVMGWLLVFRKTLNIPNTLAEVGLSIDHAQEIGIKGLADPSTACNPRTVSAEDLANIYVTAVEGRLP